MTPAEHQAQAIEALQAATERATEAAQQLATTVAALQLLTHLATTPAAPAIPQPTPERRAGPAGHAAR